MLQRLARLLAVVAILFAGLPAARSADALYGPVRPGESFWTIADALREKPRVSQEQEMLALYLYNTESFVGGLDGLQKGSTLRVPTAEQALEIPQADAGRYIANLHRYKGVPPSMQHLVHKAGAAAAAPAVEKTAAKTAAPKPEAAPASTSAQLGEIAAAAETAAAAPAEAPTTTAQPETPVPAPAPAPAPAAPTDAAASAEDASAVEALPPAGETEQPAAVQPEVAPAEPVAAQATQSAGTDILGVQLPLPMDWLILIGLGAVFLLLILLQAARVRRSLREEAQPVPPPPPRRAPVEPVVAPIAAAKPEFAEPPAPEPVREPLIASAPEPAAVAAVVEVPEALPEEPAALNDPIADADFQLGYGHFDEAIVGLEESLLVAPMSRDVIMKLAETYAVAARPAEFEQLVARYNGTFVDSDWMRVQSLGRQLRPESQLFGGWVPVPLAPAGWLQPKPADALDLSTPLPAQASSQALSVDELPPEFGEFDIDSVEAEDGPFTTDDVGTKLDLARAYLDMADQEMARSLLDEVIEQGSEAQKNEAQELRDQLPAPQSPTSNSPRDA